MKFLNDLRYLFSNRKCLIDHRDRGVELEHLGERLKELLLIDFGRGHDGYLECILQCNPLGVGTALRLVEKYGIMMYIGTYAGECRAKLGKNKWTCGGGPGMGRNCGSFFDLRDDEVCEIVGFGRSYPEAVARCLLAARECGVI